MARYTIIARRWTKTIEFQLSLSEAQRVREIGRSVGGLSMARSIMKGREIAVKREDRESDRESDQESGVRWW